jgi:prepilin-type N-terminal cleavage/methylation domain-containing protein
MKTSPSSSRQGAFTLIEIMTVVLVVGILSALAMVVVVRIKDRALRSSIQNNLRQLFQAKAYYFAETGSIQPVTVTELQKQGYLKSSTRDTLLNTHSFEANAGWHYLTTVVPDQPTTAYHGAVPPSSAPAAADVIYYPAPPKDASAYFAATAATAGAAPNLSPVSSANVPMLKTPGQVGTISVPAMSYIWKKTDWWLQQLGVVSPDGSPMTITDIRSDPPSFGNFRGTNGQYSQFDFSNPGQKGQATLYVTVQNASGRVTVPITVQTGN